ncbi:MAG: radical SAM protein [Nitrospiraceae bacterium]|nr:MAG: radical SAM protein [Nitrospiraceae bacterium]
MKTLLVSVNNEKEPFPVAPLGAAYIAGALRDNNHDVRILDLCFVQDDHYAVSESLKSFLPDVIGISIRNIDNLTFNKSAFYMPRVKNIVDLIKKHSPAPLVAGGSGFSIFPEEILKYLEIDTGIIGEGETAFLLFVDAAASGGPVCDIQNLCYIKDGKFCSNGLTYNRPGFLPDRSLLNNRMYLEFGGMANIQSKRGCPFTCSYCTYPNIDGSILRLREPADVVNEMKEMADSFNMDYVFFVDDIFNFPEEHAALICEKIIGNDLKIDWSCFATPKGMTPELAALMKRAGCKGIEFGTDGGSEITLKALGKQFSPDDIAHASECCKKVGLPDAHYIIIGGPGETVASLKETFSLFERIRPTAIIALIGLRVYPKTRLHLTALEEGVIPEEMNLFEPAFYVSPEMSVNSLSKDVAGYAEKNSNWIAPGLNIRCDADMMITLRRSGRRGPLWNMLA